MAGAFDYKQNLSVLGSKTRWRKPFSYAEGLKPGIRLLTKNQSAVSPMQATGFINSLGITASAASPTMVVGVGGAANLAATTTMASSPDGITWTARTAQSQTWNSVVWNGTAFVATGAVGLVSYSTDGITWTTGSSPLALSLNLTVFNGKVYAFPVGGSPSSYYESANNGVSWTTRTAPTAAGTPKLGVVVYGSTMYNLRGASLYSTTDGINWTLVKTFSFVGSGQSFPNFVIANRNALIVGCNIQNAISTSVSKNGGSTWSQFASVTLPTVPMDSPPYGATQPNVGGGPSYNIGPAVGRVYTVALQDRLVTSSGRMLMVGYLYEAFYDGTATVVSSYYFMMTSADGYDWTGDAVAGSDDPTPGGVSLCQFGTSVLMPLVQTGTTPVSAVPSLNLDFEELICDYS